MRCAVCGGATSALFDVGDENRRTDTRTFLYTRCERCGLVRLEDPPTDLARYYAAEYYRQPPMDELRRVARREHYQIELVLRHVPNGHLVEIGPAWGVFAVQARDAGFEVSAIEMDAACCEHLERVVGVRAICSDSPETAIGQVDPPDVVALWQVIEHLPEPWALLEAAAARLRPGGAIVVATPSPTSMGMRVMGRRWPHVDAPRHLWLIPAEVLTAELERSGLQLESLTFADRGARSWNRFAWQRLLMNRVSGTLLTRAAFVVGAVLAAAVSPLERRGRRGSSYTAVYRKPIA